MATEHVSEPGARPPKQPVVIDRFSAPARAQTNEFIEVSWNVLNSHSVRLILSGSVRAEMPVEPCGSRWFIAREPGLASIEILAEGEADDLGNLSMAHDVLGVLLQAPMPKLFAHPRVLRGQPGTYVRVQWCSDKTARVVIRRPLFDFETDAPPQGEAEILVDPLDDYVTLTAISRDAESSQTCVCRVSPVIPEIPNLDRDLYWFEEPTLEQQQWESKEKAG